MLNDGTDLIGFFVFLPQEKIVLELTIAASVIAM
jgi:hypothetical protein